MLSQWDETGKSSIENENDEVKRAPESYPRVPVPVPVPRPTRRVAMATEPLIMVVTRFGQWPWQLHRVGLVFGRGQKGKGKLWLVLPGHFCASVCACTGVRDCAVAVDVATSAQTGWPGEFLPRLRSWNETRACAGKGQSTALRCVVSARYCLPSQINSTWPTQQIIASTAATSSGEKCSSSYC